MQYPKRNKTLLGKDCEVKKIMKLRNEIDIFMKKYEHNKH